MASVRPFPLIRILCALGLVGLCPAGAIAEPSEEAPAKAKAAKPPEITVPLDLALISRVSVNRLSGRNVRNFVSLGLFSSDAARLTGLQLGLGMSGVDGAVTGVQIGGLASGAGKEVRGVQLGGLVSGAGEDVSGLQLGLLVSGAGGAVAGLQVGGLVSGAGGDLSGLQLGLLVSGSGGRVRGLQVAGLVSGAGARTSGAQFSGLVSGAPEIDGLQVSLLLNGAGAYRGLQLAGAMNATGHGSGVQVALGGNYAKRTMRGAQIGLVNIGGDVRGAQIGLVNIACHLHGAQLGLVNVSSTANGVLVGPVSYVSSASKHLEAWSGTTTPMALAWRLGRGRVYSLLAAAAHPFADAPRLSLGAGTGVEVRRRAEISIETDALLHYVLYDYELSGTDAWLAQLRGKVLYRASPRLALFAGLSLNAAISDETDSEELALALDGAFHAGDATVRIFPSIFVGVRG